MRACLDVLRLEEPLSAGWIDVPLDSLVDLAASKIVALVERGAPRDFLDIFNVCQAGLFSIAECWELWRRRQMLAGSDVDMYRARLPIETHLERIALHRPLEKIDDAQQREQAQGVRKWFLSEFLGVGACPDGSSFAHRVEGMNNHPWLDGALYPDTAIPETLETLSERVDFFARLCAAWDFGLLPEAVTIDEIRRKEWRPAVEACRLLTSPAYHLLRRWHGLSPLPWLGQQVALIRGDPCLAQV